MMTETPTITLFVNQSFWIQSETEEGLTKWEEFKNRYETNKKMMNGNDNYVIKNT